MFSGDITLRNVFLKDNALVSVLLFFLLTFENILELVVLSSASRDIYSTNHSIDTIVAGVVFWYNCVYIHIYIHVYLHKVSV